MPRCCCFVLFDEKNIEKKHLKEASKPTRLLQRRSGSLVDGSSSFRNIRARTVLILVDEVQGLWHEVHLKLIKVHILFSCALFGELEL